MRVLGLENFYCEQPVLLLIQLKSKMVEHHSHQRHVASAEDYPLERLGDPCNDRKVPNVPRPPKYPMTSANLFEERDGKFIADFQYDEKFLCSHYLPLFFAVGREVPKMDLIRKHLMIEGQIEKQCLVRILDTVKAIYRKYLI